MSIARTSNVYRYISFTTAATTGLLLLLYTATANTTTTTTTTAAAVTTSSDTPHGPKRAVKTARLGPSGSR